MPNGNYPTSVEGLVDNKISLNRDAYAALQEFVRSKVFRGEIEERKAKFVKLHEKLNAAYRLSVNLAFGELTDDGDSGSSSYNPETDTVTLRGKLSVITYLHEYAHARFGPDETEAVHWSLSVFARFFPLSFAKLVFNGHMARLPRGTDAAIADAAAGAPAATPDENAAEGEVQQAEGGASVSRQWTVIGGDKLVCTAAAPYDNQYKKEFYAIGVRGVLHPDSKPVDPKTSKCLHCGTTFDSEAVIVV